MSIAVKPRFRWQNVCRPLVPVGLFLIIGAGMMAADPWFPLFPRETGQRITEIFLRSVLIGYLTVLLLIPLVLPASIWLVIRARERGQSRPLLARAALACGSLAVAIIGLELAAWTYLVWVHRIPRLPTALHRSPSVEEEISLVVIGGSSALGYPYDPVLSVGQIVGWQIEKALHGRKVSVDIRAQLGKNLEDMHRGLAQLRKRPDAVIVYSGHNEFLSRFETSRDAGYAEAPRGALLNRLYRVSLHSPLCLWIYEAVRKHRLGGPPPPVNHHLLIDAPLFTPSEHLELLTDFRVRLEAIAEYCVRIGAVPILVIPPANESGFEPSRSVLPVPLSPEEREALSQQFLSARAIERETPRQSIDRYRSLLDQQPDFAEVHFRLARLLESAGELDEARRQYIQARDLDGFPVRCRSEFAQVYCDVAARHDSILVDGPEFLRSRSTHGILGDELFHDAHHPTFAGHVALAQAIMDQLFQRRALGLGVDKAKAPLIDLAECAAHFGVNSRVWAGACIKAGTYYKHLAGARYDHAEREAKHLLFMKAGSDLQAGRTLPQTAGIPGIGLSPSLAFRWDWWVNQKTPGVPPEVQ
jgi:hypothetical protein